MTPIEKLDAVLNFLCNDYPIYKRFTVIASYQFK